MVTPFVAPLRRWIKKFKKARQQGKARKNAALKVVMDQVENDSEDETEENESEFGGDHVNEYAGAVPAHQQVHLEDSLKKLLGLNMSSQHPDEWDYANRMSHSLPDPNRVQPIPFGTMPGMELPSIYSQEQYNPSHVPLVQPMPPGKYVQDRLVADEQVESETEDTKQRNSLLDILVGKQPHDKPERKKKVSKKEIKIYGEINILKRDDSVSIPPPRTASPPPKKELVELLLNSQPLEPTKPAIPAINTEGLLKLLVQTQSPRPSDPGLEQLLSGKRQLSPLHPEKQSLEDILRGAPPLPIQRQTRPTMEEQRMTSPRIIGAASPRVNPGSTSSMRPDISLQSSNSASNRFEKPPLSHTVSEQIMMNSKPPLERNFSAGPNPFANSLLDILVQPPKNTSPLTPGAQKDKQSDLLNLLLNK
jgi:hypothetical protein